ncbi:hypothetical protein FKM82_028999 [Ascaphus truei]
MRKPFPDCNSTSEYHPCHLSGSNLVTSCLSARRFSPPSEMDVGCSKSAQHTIQLNDATPFRECSRRIAPRHVDDERDFLKEMETAGIVTDSAC